MSTENGFNSLDRMNRGMEIAEKKVINENADGSFSVPSATVEEIAYLVRMIDGKYLCNCMDFKQRHEQVGLCKHIHAVKFWIASQVELKQQPKPKVFAEDSIQCDRCGSIRVIHYGISAGKQAFYCKDCKHKFAPSLIKKAKYSPKTVSLTLDLYFSGMSSRKIVRTLNDHYNLNLGSASIYRWIQRYIPLISEYANSLSPQLSDTWHADELFVKMKDGITIKAGSNMAFLWNIHGQENKIPSSLEAFKIPRSTGSFPSIQRGKSKFAWTIPREDSHGCFRRLH